MTPFNSCLLFKMKLILKVHIFIILCSLSLQIASIQAYTLSNRATRNRSGNLNDASDSSPKKTKGNTRSSSILVESTSKGPNEEQIVEFAGCLNSVTKYGIEERAAALFCLAQRHFSGKMPQDNKPEEGRPQKKHKLPKIQRPPSMRKKNDGNDDTQQYSFFTSALMMLQPNI